MPVDDQAVRVKPSDDHFWFRTPGIVLYLIHFILFQNAFEIAFFFWILVSTKQALSYLIAFMDPPRLSSDFLNSARTASIPALWKVWVISFLDSLWGKYRVFAQFFLDFLFSFYCSFTDVQAIASAASSYRCCAAIVLFLCMPSSLRSDRSFILSTVILCPSSFEFSPLWSY